MSDYKYTLIVSQYRHSRHMFLVKHNPETFLESAKNFTAELEKYKRNEDFERDIDLGDLVYHKEDVIHSRYNINDFGDIYFINAEYANGLMHDAIEYHEASRRESVGFKKKGVTESIEKHHSLWKVKEILLRHFEIA